MSAHVPHFNRRVLAVFLIVGLPILVAGVGLVLAVGQAQLRDNYGRHLGQVAQQTAAAIDAYIYRRLIDISLLARTPDLRRAAAEASAAPFDQAEVERLDAAWQKPGAPPPPLAAILDNATSHYLADLVAHDQIYKELLLTDRQGRLVAASHKVSDFYQADEDWWRAASELGRTSVSDVRWDASSGRYAIEVAVPVPGPGGERLAGILKVVADSREMLAMVGGVQLGATGQAMLVRDNGSIVFGRRVTNPNARFFAADALRQRAEALRQGGPEQVAFFEALAPNDEPELVGVAPSQLSLSYPTLSWFVVVTQTQSELLAPVRALGWYLLAALGLTVLAVMVLALWLSIRIERPAFAEEMHLVEHAPVMHVGESEGPALGPR
jgi:hypothetical protein